MLLEPSGTFPTNEFYPNLASSLSTASDGRTAMRDHRARLVSFAACYVLLAKIVDVFLSCDIGIAHHPVALQFNARNLFDESYHVPISVLLDHRGR